MEHPHFFEIAGIEINRELVDEIIFKEHKINHIASGVARRLGINRVRRANVIHALQFSNEFCLNNDLLSFSVVFDTKNIEKRNLFGAVREAYVGKAEIRAEMAPFAENEIILGQQINYLKQPITDISFQFQYQDKVKALWNIFAKEMMQSGFCLLYTSPSPRDRG